MKLQMFNAQIRWLIIILFFSLGCCIYSFLNVVIYRIQLHMDFIMTRSRCVKCGHKLTFLDMFPIVGWVMLRGKCRYCHAKISVIYPIVEALGGILALLCIHKWGVGWQAMVSYLFLAVLTVIAFIDMYMMKIPNPMIIAAGITGLFSIPVFPDISMFERVMGFLSVSALLFLIALLIPKGFGGGDIKLTAVCGFFLGWRQNLAAFVLAVLIAGIYCLLMLAVGKLQRKSKISFGTFLCLGVAIILFAWI